MAFDNSILTATKWRKRLLLLLSSLLLLLLLLLSIADKVVVRASLIIGTKQRKFSQCSTQRRLRVEVCTLIMIIIAIMIVIMIVIVIAIMIVIMIVIVIAIMIVTVIVIVSDK